MPWIFSQKECSEFWLGVDNNSSSVGNRPRGYSGKDSTIVELLQDFWTPYVPKSDAILELGCNCGANLRWLQQLGYCHLNGLEINPSAIEQMKASFPELYKKINLFEGNMGDLLPPIASNSMDVVFTMGVAMHIHPAQNKLFAEMVRISRKYVCTIEPETANSNYVFARNYRRVFEKYGCAQLRATRINADVCADPAYWGCTVRFLKKNKLL
ncbi:MAG: class I SAM-dependent methyltransferase [Candidatus Omnitrophota bacterium]